MIATPCAVRRRSRCCDQNEPVAGVDWADVAAPDLAGVAAAAADLDGAELEPSDLDGAELEPSDLDGAGVEAADLDGAAVEPAGLAGAGVDSDMALCNLYTLLCHESRPTATNRLGTPSNVVDFESVG